MEEGGSIVKKFRSQKKIASNTVTVCSKYINIDEEGSLNVWHKQTDLEKEGQDTARSLNPESFEDIDTSLFLPFHGSRPMANLICESEVFSTSLDL